MVWCGEDELLQRPVAVKEILVPMAGENEREAIRARVLREARALARLHSPSIVSVYDVAEEQERHWIIMELVDAESLGDVIKNHGPLPFDQVAAIGLALTDALATAHSAGVLHRDVKPGNVLLGRDGRVRLTDFGIAATEGDVPLPGTGALVGSPAYIAPERIRGSSGTPASDLWGLGATLYAAVEGSPPFEGPETYAVLTAVVEGRRRPFRLAGPLRGLLADLLDRPAELRPNVDEIRRRLIPIARNAAPVPASVMRRERPPAAASGDQDRPPSDDGLENLHADPPQPAAGAAAAARAPEAAGPEAPVREQAEPAADAPTQVGGRAVAADDDQTVVGAGAPSGLAAIGFGDDFQDDGFRGDAFHNDAQTQVGSIPPAADDLDLFGDMNEEVGLLPVDHPGETPRPAGEPPRRSGAAHRSHSARKAGSGRRGTVMIIAAAAGTAVAGGAVALAVALSGGGDDKDPARTAEGITPSPTVVTVSPQPSPIPTTIEPVETPRAPVYTRQPRPTAPAVEPTLDEPVPPSPSPTTGTTAPTGAPSASPTTAPSTSGPTIPTLPISQYEN